MVSRHLFAHLCLAPLPRGVAKAAKLDHEQFSSPHCGFNCSSNRQWIYQSCAEFGYFQTAAAGPGDPERGVAPTTAASSPFAAFRALNATNAGARVCEAAFNLTRGSYRGPAALGAVGGGGGGGGGATGSVLGRALAANVRYGARVVAAENVTMPNGSLDPWHALGVVNASDPFFESGSPQVTG